MVLPQANIKYKLNHHVDFHNKLMMGTKPDNRTVYSYLGAGDFKNAGKHALNAARKIEDAAFALKKKLGRKKPFFKYQLKSKEKIHLNYENHLKLGAFYHLLAFEGFYCSKNGDHKLEAQRSLVDVRHVYIHLKEFYERDFCMVPAIKNKLTDILKKIKEVDKVLKSLEEETNINIY